MSNQKSNKKKPPQSDKIVDVTKASTGTYEGVALAAMEISRRRRAQLRAIRTALVEGRDDDALQLVRGLFGFYLLDDEGGRCEEKAEIH